MNTTTFVQITKLLERDPLIYRIFKNCPYQILKNIDMRYYKAGEFLLTYEKLNNRIFFIVDGHAEHFVVSECGKKYCLGTYKKGAFVGTSFHSASISNTSSIIAKGPLTTLELNPAAFENWLDLDRNLSHYFTQYLNQNCSDALKQLEELTLYTLRQRIYRFLLENADENGIIRKTISIELLSESMGVTSRSVQRILKEFKDEEIIIYNGTNIILPRQQ